MENHATESINPTEHEVVLPNSKTINIEGTNFKYEVHYDQLDDTDLLMIEKYANHIFHAYQERYGLDMSTDYTFKGFIYNSSTDLRNARPGHNTAYAGTSFHHYPHNSGSIAHDLTKMIYFTLSLYNKEKHGIPPNENHFIRNVAKELKAIRLDDNQGESNTEEKSKTTINQEELNKIESSGSEEEKPKVEEKKIGQEERSPEEHQPINQEESKKVEPSGSDEEKGKVEEEKIGQEERSLEEHQPINQEESKKVESSGSEEEKSSQEEINPETMLPHSKREC